MARKVYGIDATMEFKVPKDMVGIDTAESVVLDLLAGVNQTRWTLSLQDTLNFFIFTAEFDVRTEDDLDEIIEEFRPTMGDQNLMDSRGDYSLIDDDFEYSIDVGVPSTPLVVDAALEIFGIPYDYIDN